MTCQRVGHTPAPSPANVKRGEGWQNDEPLLPSLPPKWPGWPSPAKSRLKLTFNELVDAHNERDDEISWLKAKVADLEDRSRWNNVKIRGIPESVTAPDLNTL